MGIRIKKTNASRILDRNKIDYELVEYPVDPDDLSAVHVASLLGEDIERVFKTLVLHGAQNGFFVCVIPGNKEVDLKKAANVMGEKKVELIPMKDLFGVTGYIRGGCTSIGMKKNYPVIYHISCLRYDHIFISAGVRGMQIKAAPKALIDVVQARTADIIKSE